MPSGLGHRLYKFLSQQKITNILQLHMYVPWLDNVPVQATGLNLCTTVSPATAIFIDYKQI